jgi:glycine cleavage system regulatory protein
MNARAVGTKSDALNVMVARVILQTSGKLINSNIKKIGREGATLPYTILGIKSGSRFTIL